jgi:uncharacterized protein YndB with AHSA1/START domain
MSRFNQPLDHDEVSATVAAPPDRLYDLIADVTRMPELSPELVECRWLDGATQATVGARFAARNKVTRGPSWVNKPVITSAEPGRRISWARTEPFGGTVEWAYEFEPQADGKTLVRESYQVTKPIARLGWLLIGSMTATDDRRGQIRDGMRKTLDRIRDIAER